MYAILDQYEELNLILEAILFIRQLFYSKLKITLS